MENLLSKFMVKEYVFIPSNVCSREMHIIYDGEIIKDLKVIGGCNGNLKGVSALIKDLSLKDAYEKLKGICCGNKATSCPDQISIALSQIMDKENIEY